MCFVNVGVEVVGGDVVWRKAENSDLVAGCPDSMIRLHETSESDFSVGQWFSLYLEQFSTVV